MKKRYFIIFLLSLFLFTSNAYAADYKNYSSVVMSDSSLVQKSITMVLADEDNSSTYCPLGEHVTQDLYGALKIFKIVAPLLCLGLSIFDFVKTVSMGEADSELKKVYNRFLKRLGLTILLFFLPVLVDAAMQLLDVWDNTGHCVLADNKNKDLENSGDAKCYLCDTNGVYYWDSYDKAKSKCSGVLKLQASSLSSSECKGMSAACYKCSDGTYGWYTEPQAKNNCSGTLTKTDIEKSLCSTGGYACYKCNSGKVHPDAKEIGWSTLSEFKKNCNYGDVHIENISKENCHE